ncbi:hypothetical protein FK531_05595 [Rhodococcus spelaei]|uniref:Uncharacterized protein n=1 Tax=Rhodococcus spelaei TaxID=2546320 RepID=A0A541BP65_9NOCA|nr:hypothetical protein [Rhodococcus spelaei]TQF74124.1 hypothetical protein FK531_05595 [Rhodococcus spelaei]
MRIYTGTVWAEEQVFICDSGDPFSRSESIDFNNSGVGPFSGQGIILFAIPEYYGSIQVTVQVHDSDPGLDAETWSRVAEGNFATDLGELRVLGAEMNEATGELDQPLTSAGAYVAHLRLHVRPLPVPEQHTWEDIGAVCLVQLWITGGAAQTSVDPSYR